MKKTINVKKEDLVGRTIYKDVHCWIKDIISDAFGLSKSNYKIIITIEESDEVSADSSQS